jgi:GT2 family glycosyltransferase
MVDEATVASVVIGRNEGLRLVRCLAALKGQISQLVYVDSGSTDNSVVEADSAGAEVVELDPAVPFTAARARNSGLAKLRGAHRPRYVQFIDGDCELQPDWLPVAIGFLEATPSAAAVCGRLRERHPELSIYNRVCDLEWDTPIGRTKACGGIAVFRMAALDQVGDFNPALIAGEEPELCLRLRQHGWEIWRLDVEMATHDAAMTRFSQWWKRSRRSGFAAAEGFAMHGGAPERHGFGTVLRALLWGAGLPAATLALASVAGAGALFLTLAYPLQIIRLAVKRGGSLLQWQNAMFLTLGKFAEFAGIVEYVLARSTGTARKIIEYK